MPNIINKGRRNNPLLVREFSEVGSFNAAQAEIASVIATVMRNPAIERPGVTIEKLEALRQNHT